MRPLRLEIAGFAAFADPVVVDFTGVELAAFVGATGAGKSSVIDAMTFALYGAVARYDQRAVAPVINQLSAEAKVRFDFELSGATYTVVRVARRTKTGASTKEARLERAGEVLAGDERSLSAAVVELLGLDFDKFNKTVVLPQGRFAEFLHDKPADRQELLRGLLGIGVYERIGRLARERAAVARNAFDMLDEQLGRIGDVSDEHLAELVARAEGIAAVLAAVASIGAEVASLDVRLAEVDRRVTEVRARHDVVAATVVPDGVADLDAALVAARAAAGEAAAAHDSCVVALDAAVAAAERGPSEAAMRVLLHAHQTLAGAEADLATAVGEVGAADAALAVATATAEQVRDRRLAAVAAAAQAERVATESADELRAGGDPGQVRHLIELHTRRAVLAAEVAPAAAADDEAARLAESARRVHAEAIAALASDERLAPAAALAEHLAVGARCPVCDQMVSTLPSTHGDHAAAITAARDAERVAAGAAGDAEVAQRRRGVELAERRAALAAIDGQLVDHPPVAQLRELAARLAALTAAADDARAAAALARQAVTTIESDPVGVRAIDAASSATAAAAAARAVLQRVETSRAAAAQAVAGHIDRAAAEQALAEAQRLADVRAHADTATRAAAAARRGADEAVAAVEGRERVARAAYDAVRERLAAVAPTGSLPTRSGGLADDWVALVGWSAEATARLDVELAGAGATRTAVVAERADLLAELVAALAAVPGAAPAVHDVDVDVDGERRRLDGLLVDARAAVQTLEAERRRVAELQREADEWRERAAVAGMLGNLLRTDAFERWLLDEALADLVARANVRLNELTGGQYSLAAADGVFRVVDHRNADEERDARSLSGGETFLTSLALALALADSSVDAAAEGGEPIESIFLDEGFGTLDPDTLDVVAGTIEDLGAGGRMVGIITHIRELAERMPTRFEITKGPRTSVVERVDV